MAWFVQPLQRKNKAGEPMGLWHLCAQSDEGGGFAAGCDHDHASAEEARQCLDARKEIGTVTGFPIEMDKITINGAVHEWPHDDRLSYEQVCKLAEQPEGASATYRVKLNGDLTRSGILSKGETIKPDDGMHISCIMTGSA